MNNEQSPVAAIFAYLKNNAVFLDSDEKQFVESVESFYRERGFVSQRQQNCIMGYYNLVERILRALDMQADASKASEPVGPKGGTAPQDGSGPKGTSQ